MEFLLHGESPGCLVVPCAWPVYKQCIHTEQVCWS
jgi:hypothetical protein